MKSTAILIPARYESERFPGKPLCDLVGKPMIQVVHDRCKESIYDVYVLTDDSEIAGCVKSFGGNVVVDTNVYDNGTERCAGAIKSSIFDNYDRFVNVQGDMPDVTLEMIQKTIWSLNRYSVSTMATSMPEREQNDPNIVKLVRAADKCLWFGRGMVGYGDWHLGIYGYRRNALEMYPSLFSPREERLEGLEQLRWLKGGWDIGVFPCEFNGTEINTPEDAERWNDSIPRA